MSLHEAAQSLWWFVVLALAVVGFGIWRGINEDKEK